MLFRSPSSYTARNLSDIEQVLGGWLGWDELGWEESVDLKRPSFLWLLVLSILFSRSLSRPAAGPKVNASSRTRLSSHQHARVSSARTGHTPMSGRQYSAYPYAAPRQLLNYSDLDAPGPSSAPSYVSSSYAQVYASGSGSNVGSSGGGGWNIGASQHENLQRAGTADQACRHAGRPITPPAASWLVPAAPLWSESATTRRTVDSQPFAYIQLSKALRAKGRLALRTQLGISHDEIVKR